MKKLLIILAGVFLAAATLEAIPEKCPFCGKDTVRPIGYGYPSWETREMAKRGELVLGGCVVDEFAPRWSCISCKKNEVLPVLEIRLVAKNHEAEVKKLNAFLKNGGDFFQYSETPAGTEFLKINDKYYLVERAALEFTTTKSVEFKDHVNPKTDFLAGTLLVALTAKDNEIFTKFNRRNAGRQAAIFTAGSRFGVSSIPIPVNDGRLEITADILSAAPIAEWMQKLSEQRHAEAKNPTEKNERND